MHPDEDTHRRAPEPAATNEGNAVAHGQPRRTSPMVVPIPVSHAHEYFPFDGGFEHLAVEGVVSWWDDLHPGLVRVDVLYVADLGDDPPSIAIYLPPEGAHRLAVWIEQTADAVERFDGDGTRHGQQMTTL